MPLHFPLSDDQRFPAIGEAGRAQLRALREHPRAPRWNLACGDRLRPEHHDALADYAESLRTGQASETREAFAERVQREVPFYRERARPGASFEEIPTFKRAELARAPWAFVPDGQALDDLLVYPTSGTTGPAFEVYSHPVAANAYLPFMQAALARVGVVVEGGPGRVSLACVHHQRGTYTYPSLMSWLGGAAFVKVNLHPDQWNDPADIVPFLEELAPEVWTGDPFAFAKLAELNLSTRPKALISSATALSPGMRRALESAFACPVLDFYSLTEARLVAVDLGRGHELIAPHWHVEILRSDTDQPVGPGERGEVVLSGGGNPLLPLLRYRTGDFARSEPGRLLELEGRGPVCLLDAAGEVVNTIDVSRALAPFALPRFQLHQSARGELTLRADVGDPTSLKLALEPLFSRPIRFEPLGAPPGEKVLQYASELPWPGPLAATLGAGG